jgi:chromosome segregation ATPase
MQVQGIPPAIIAAAAAEMQRGQALRDSQKAADEQMAAFKRSQEEYRKQRETVTTSIKAIKEEIATIGMSADAIELRRLANSKATPDELKQFAALQRHRAALQKQVAAQDNLRDSLTETTKRLKEQIATAGMSAEQTELWRLKQAGATPEQLAQIAALQGQAKAAGDATRAKEQLADADRTLTAATRGSAEAMERVDAYRKMLATQKPVVQNWRGIMEGVPPIAQTSTMQSGNPPEENLLAQAVTLLARIAAATDRDPIDVEVTA